jgi:uncharacterized damage-inducible protein DinB
MGAIELVRYNHVVRKLYFDALSKLSWLQIVEHRGASFDSLRNVFLHLTIAEDRWVNFIIPGRFGRWVEVDFEDYKNINSLKNYMENVKTKTEAYLEKVTPEELSRQIVVPWGISPDIKITIDAALTHMVLEDMIHYGELSALLWQIGEEAPYLGFWRLQNR